MRRTMLFLGVMTLMLVVAGGVALAKADCRDTHTFVVCYCHPGVLCEGTNVPKGDLIDGSPSGDNIYAYEGHDQIAGFGGSDYVEAGPGDDELFGDDQLPPGHKAGDDTLIGGDGDDFISGGEGNDRCYGGPGTDEFDPSCEERVQ